MSDPISIETHKLVIGAAAAPISQAIRPGEIVGLAGLDGHGQERFLEVLAGLKQPVSGEVFLDKRGSRTRVTGFRAAVAHGVAYLPRDRRATGIFPTQSVLDNFAISTVGRDALFGLIRPQNRRRRYEIYRDKLSISAPGVYLDVPKGTFVKVHIAIIPFMGGCGQRIQITNLPSWDGVSGWSVLWRRLNANRSDNPGIPTLAEILMMTSTISSVPAALEARRLADLYLNPPISGVKLTEWSAIERAVLSIPRRISS